MSSDVAEGADIAPSSNITEGTKSTLSTDATEGADTAPSSNAAPHGNTTVEHPRDKLSSP
jgi:hypothetical protein